MGRWQCPVGLLMLLVPNEMKSHSQPLSVCGYAVGPRWPCLSCQRCRSTSTSREAGYEGQSQMPSRSQGTGHRSGPPCVVCGTSHGQLLGVVFCSTKTGFHTSLCFVLFSGSVYGNADVTTPQQCAAMMNTQSILLYVVLPILLAAVLWRTLVPPLEPHICRANVLTGEENHLHGIVKDVLRYHQCVSNGDTQSCSVSVRVGRFLPPSGRNRIKPRFKPPWKK